MLAPNVQNSGRGIRSVFISDLHLGSKFSRVESLLEFLQRIEPDHLYLVGDIVDGWCLRRRWRWPETYNRLLERLVDLAASGTVIRLTPGNHDEFLRRFLLNNELVSIRNEFIHVGADDRRMMILHGDLFDNVESQFRWLSIIGNVGYELILRADHWANLLLKRFGFRRIRISRTIKQRVKHVVQFANGFESQVAAYARENSCDTVICGHIHIPALKPTDDVLYINLGDWVENSTALVEYDDGHLQLLDVDSGIPLAESFPANAVGDGPESRRANQDLASLDATNAEPACP